MSDVATMVEYRLIRPDGTLLWTCVAPDDVPVPLPPVKPEWAQHPEASCLPPWRYESRAADTAEWTLIGED